MSFALKQGNLDSGCGLYATLNAIAEINGMSFDRAKDVFQEFSKRQPYAVGKALRSGLFFSELRDIVPMIIEVLEPEERVKAQFPFKNKKFKAIQDFSAKLSTAVNDIDDCAIVGFGQPWNHWTVVTKVTKDALILKDSAGYHRRMKKSLEIVNEIDEYTTRTQVFPRQTILFSKLN